MNTNKYSLVDLRESLAAQPGHGEAMLSYLLTPIRGFWKRFNSRISDEDVRCRIRELDEARAKDITIRFSRGNVSLQDGATVTAEELDREFGEAPWRDHA